MTRPAASPLARRALPLLLAAAGLGGAAAARPGVAARQLEAGLVLPPADDRGALGAELAVPTLALGAFRGLLADYLWLRSIGLREQGRHFEARQLAEQLTRLQPRLTAVWVFLGHDLAYNMASASVGADARWRWINNGIELLRDRGLVHDPEAHDLHEMLARIYQDRIGAAYDDHHLELKRRLVVDMERALGGDGRAGALEALAAAPDPRALVRDDPAAARLAALAAEHGVDPLDGLVLLDPAAAPAAALPTDPTPAALLGLDPEAARALEAALAASPAWPRLGPALRAARLRRLHRLDPARMLEVDRAWGPLDWRGCDALAIYWATAGLPHADRRQDVRAALLLRRTAIMALKNAARRGRVEALPGGGVYTAPLVGLIGRVEQVMREGIADAEARKEGLRRRLASGRGGEAEVELMGAIDGYLRNQRSAREDFLLEGIMLLTEYGRDLDARRLQARAQRDFPDNPTYQRSYDDFVIFVLAQRFTDAGTFDTQQGVTRLLEGTWLRAFAALAHGQDEHYAGLERLARASLARWDRHLRAQERDEPGIRARLGVPAEQVRARALGLAARALAPPLRARLAERLGVDPEALLAPGAEAGRPPGAGEGPASGAGGGGR